MKLRLNYVDTIRTPVLRILFFFVSFFLYQLLLLYSWRFAISHGAFEPLLSSFPSVSST